MDFFKGLIPLSVYETRDVLNIEEYKIVPCNGGLQIYRGGCSSEYYDSKRIPDLRSLLWQQLSLFHFLSLLLETDQEH